MTEHKPWGRQRVLWIQEDFEIRKLDVLPGKTVMVPADSSASVTVLSGYGKAELEDGEKMLNTEARSHVSVRAREPHLFRNESVSETLTLLVVSHIV